MGFGALVAQDEQGPVGVRADGRGDEGGREPPGAGGSRRSRPPGTARAGRAREPPWRRRPPGPRPGRRTWSPPAPRGPRRASGRTPGTRRRTGVLAAGGGDHGLELLRRPIGSASGTGATSAAGEGGRSRPTPNDGAKRAGISANASSSGVSQARNRRSMSIPGCSCSQRANPAAGSTWTIELEAMAEPGLPAGRRPPDHAVPPILGGHVGGAGPPVGATDGEIARPQGNSRPEPTWHTADMERRRHYRARADSDKSVEITLSGMDGGLAGTSRAGQPVGRRCPGQGSGQRAAPGPRSARR